MRYAPLQIVKEGSVLGKTIYGHNGAVLLQAGVTLTNNYIKKLKKLGLNGLYIKDEISKGVEVKSVINEGLKNKAVLDIKNTFVLAESSSRSNKERIDNYNKLNETISSFIDEISRNDNLVINIIDLKIFDDYTFFHSVNVAILSIVIGMSLNLARKDIHNLGIAAIMHDIGKVFIPIDILNKKDKLNQKELRIIKKHSKDGFLYLKEKYPVPYKCYEGVLHHHERYDGSGYPLTLKGNQISLFGRIIAIADVYDALISDRPYRKGFAPNEALEYILAGGDNLFDMELVEKFTRKIQPYPAGTIVKLSNGLTAIVIENFEGRGFRPVVKVFKDGDKKISPYILDLWDSDTMSITIVDQVNDI